MFVLRKINVINVKISKIQKEKCVFSSTSNKRRMQHYYLQRYVIVDAKTGEWMYFPEFKTKKEAITCVEEHDGWNLIE